MVRSDPRHAMANLISLSGIKLWISDKSSGLSKCRFPTLGSSESTLSNTWDHASNIDSEFCLPFSFRRFTGVSAVISDDLASFGLA